MNYKGAPVNYRGDKGAQRREPTAAARSKFCQRFAYKLQGRPCKLQGHKGEQRETDGGRQMMREGRGFRSEFLSGSMPVTPSFIFD